MECESVNGIGGTGRVRVGVRVGVRVRVQGKELMLDPCSLPLTMAHTLPLPSGYHLATHNVSSTKVINFCKY